MDIVEEIHEEVAGTDYQDLDEDYHGCDIAHGVTIEMGALSDTFIEIVRYDDKLIVEHNGLGATYFDPEKVEFDTWVDENEQWFAITNGSSEWRGTRYAGLCSQ